jgi:branched-chain amino acid transport system permease protein
MTPELFVQLLINGLMIGGIYALVASGFTLILGVLQVFNFAQGQFYMLGAFVAYAVASVLGAPYIVAVIASLVAMAALGIFVHFSMIKWTLRSGFFHTMLVTVAFGAILSQLAVLQFGRSTAVVSPVIQGTIRLWGLNINPGKLLVLFGAVIVMGALYWFLRTKIGVAMMACAENREIACLQGINANKVFWVTMAVGCGLCGIAGALVVPVLSASTAMGQTMFLKAMLVVLVGGTGSMAGALLAAFLVGIVESFAFQFVGSFSTLVVFGLVALLIYFRPGGLLGKPLPIPGQ